MKQVFTLGKSVYHQIDQALDITQYAHHTSCIPTYTMILIHGTPCISSSNAKHSLIGQGADCDVTTPPLQSECFIQSTRNFIKHACTKQATQVFHI